MKERFCYTSLQSHIFLVAVKRNTGERGRYPKYWYQYYFIIVKCTEYNEKLDVLANNFIHEYKSMICLDTKEKVKRVQNIMSQRKRKCKYKKVQGHKKVDWKIGNSSLAFERAILESGGQRGGTHSSIWWYLLSSICTFSPRGRRESDWIQVLRYHAGCFLKAAWCIGGVDGWVEGDGDWRLSCMLDWVAFTTLCNFLQYLAEQLLCQAALYPDKMLSVENL